MSETPEEKMKQVAQKIISQQETVNILKALSMKVDVANAQILNLGLLTEYLYEKLADAKIELHIDAFPEWAAERHEEIKKQASEMIEQGVVDDLKEELEKASNINLTE
jgi:hypothetical protein